MQDFRDAKMDRMENAMVSIISQNRVKSNGLNESGLMNTACIMRIAIALILVLLTASAASAATITVDDSGGAMYTTIQAAVNAASGGDVIEVAAGTYFEHVVVNKPITLVGESNINTLIDGIGSGNVVEVAVDEVTVDGFGIQNGSTGIFVSSNNSVIKNNIIKKMVGEYGINVGSYGGSGGGGGISIGIYLSDSANNTLTSNTVNNITGGIGGNGGVCGSGGAGGTGAGIYLSGSANNTLTSNTINNITGGIGGNGGVEGSDGANQVGYGVYLEIDSYQNTISSNTMDGDPIIFYHEANDIVIENHVLIADSNPTNLGKIVLINSRNTIIQNNIISNFIGGANGTGGAGGAGGIGTGIYLSGSTNNTLTSNTINNITGGTGGTGGYGGSGGAGGIGTGIYLSFSTNNTLTSNTINNITGGIGGTGGDYNLGGAGGIGTGISLLGSVNNTLTSNIINNITGGTGGIAGKYQGSGGAGGIGTGISLLGSVNNTLTSNTISNITGGTGGNVGSGGAGGIGTGIFLSGSVNNILTSNTISNITGGTGGTGGYACADGADQVSYGIYLETDSHQNIVSSNTMDGDLIIYYYGVNGIVIENHVLIVDSNPTNLGKIVLINSSNTIIQNNIVSNFTGGTGGTGARFSLGGAGGTGTGIYLSGSTNNTLTSNTISNIIGGIGGTGGYAGSAGGGGIGTGIFLSGSVNNILTSNTISNITGGTGGTGGAAGANGADQVSYGVYLEIDSYQNVISSSTMDGDSIIYYYGVNSIVIENHVLTADSNPTNLGKIVLINSSNTIIMNNIISNFTGGTGGTGGYQSSGGAGSIGTGIYLSGSTNNTLTFNTINNITGGVGGTGGPRGSGGTGGIGAGIYLSVSVNNRLTSNTISNIAGGTGGTGGLRSSGGAGGIGAGIYLSGSINNPLTSNTISNIAGGTGGTIGHQGSGGVGGIGYSIYLKTSPLNRLLHNNLLNNDENAYDDASNYWDTGSQGNYYSDYIGNDNNSDGIGDTPYNITGGSNVDNYPLMPLSESFIFATIVSPSTTPFNLGQNIEFISSVVNGVSPYVYTWTSSKDGIIGNTSSFTHSNLSLGTHTISLNVIDSNNNITSDAQTIRIRSTDLTIASSDITFSNSWPTQDESITINANIHNEGNENVNDVSVKFYDENTYIGEVILPQISYHSFGNVSLQYAPSTPGYPLIKAVVDENNNINEVNEDNNEAIRPIAVGNGNYYGGIELTGSVDTPRYTGENVRVYGNAIYNTTYGSGSPVAGAKVNITIDGQTYTTYTTSSGTYTTDIIAPYTSGNYGLVIHITDNTFAAEYTDATLVVQDWPQPYPDLFVESIYYSPTPVQNASSTVYAQVRNIGRSDASNVQVNFYDDGVLMSTQTISNLPSGATSTPYVSWTPSYSNTHKITVKVDENNEITEVNDANNHASKNVYVYPDIADFTPVWIGSSDSTPAVNQPQTLTTQIRNIGGISGTTKVSFYDNNVLIGNASVNVNGMNNYAYASIAHTFDTIGNHVVKVRVNPDSDPVELNYNNNEYTVSYYVHTPLPDLYVSSITTNNANPVTNDSVQISTSIYNRGETDAYDVTVHIYDGALLLDNITIPLVQTGQTQQVSTIWVPSTYGQHTIQTKVDPDNTITESREYNNIGTKYVYVYPQEIDLVAVDVSFSQNAVEVDYNVDITATIQNMGGIDASDVQIGFYDNDTIIALSSISVPAKGSISTTTIAHNFSESGNHIISIKADPYNAMAEADETNNETSRSINILPPSPDFSVSSITFNNSTPIHGDAVKITALIQNSGKANASNVLIRFYNDNVGIGDKIISVANNSIESVSLDWVSIGGDYTIKVKADPTNALIESNENNNSLTKGIQVRAPDIQVLSESIVFNNTNPNLTEPVKIYGNITNIGTLSTDNIQVSFYIDNILIDQQSIATLAEDSYQLLNTTWYTQGKGTHVVKISTVSDGFYELSESNNDATRGLVVRNSRPIDSSTGEGTVYFETEELDIGNLTALNESDIAKPHPNKANLGYGLFRFKIIDMPFGGTVSLNLKFPKNLPPGTAYWKYGPTLTNTTPHWYMIPSSVNGNKITFQLTDGGLGDDDLLVNGIIKDDGGPSLPSFINGTVLDDGIGIAGAVVTTDTGVSTAANESGFYSLSLGVGTYNLTATKEPEYYSNSSVAVDTVSGETVVRDIELVKKPTGTISGNVANASL